MLTRVLLALAFICGMAGASSAEDAKVVVLGITTHEVTQAEIEKGSLPTPQFNTPAVAYVLATNLKKGDVVDIELVNGDTSLMRNSQTVAEDQATVLLQAGKRGVPAGGWPEGAYHAALKITREGKTLLEQSSQPVQLN